MRIWGKVLGFLFGFMLSKNIFGALLGMWLGHRFDRGIGLDFSDLTKNESNIQADFFYSTFSVMGFLAKANGRVSEHEIAFASAYMDQLGLTGEMRAQAQEAFREGKTVGFPFVDRLKKFKRSCGNRHDLLLMFLEIQIQLAFADGELDSDERQVLHTIAKTLGFSQHDLDRLLDMIIAGAQFQQGAGNSHVDQAQQLSSAYKILGVSENSTKQEIKKAYRKLMAQHHPDKLVAKGLPPEMMEMAKQKAQEIQAAYDLVTKK